MGDETKSGESAEAQGAAATAADEAQGALQEGKNRARAAVAGVTGAVATRARGAERGARRALARGVRFAREHPTATIAAAVGLGALAEAQLAAAALVGIGVTALVTRKTGADFRRDLATWFDRGRTRVAQGLAQLEKSIAPGEDQSSPPPEPQPQSQG